MLAAGLLLGGCKIVALGDSNTCREHPCGAGDWPAKLQWKVWYRGWWVENRGMAGMTAGKFFRADTEVELQSPFTGEPLSAGFHLDRLLAEEHLAFICRVLPHAALAPIVVIALGTNDVTVHSGEQAAEDILALEAKVREAAPCVPVFVALVPSHAPPGWKHDAEIRHANERLLARVPRERVIDFNAGFGPADFDEDGVHVNARGQAKRAELVRRAVFP